MSLENVFIILALINLCFSLVPTWKFDQNGVSFFPSGSNNRDIEAYNYENYKLTNKYTKNSDGTITVQHKLNITKNSNTNSKSVDFENIQVFKYIARYGEIIVLKGNTFHIIQMVIKYQFL